jgi:RNA polymerase sigma-70 factor (ECF subfamily)
MAVREVRRTVPSLRRSGDTHDSEPGSPLSTGEHYTLIGKRALRDSRLGGNSAFEQMAADHLRVVYRTAVRLAGRAHDAEDLAQETFLRAWRSRHTFQPETNAKAWLLRILHNVHVDRFRAGRRMVPVVSELDGPGSAFAMPDTPESLVLAGFMETEVFEALRGLPERFRTCLILADLHGRSHAEIAKGLGVPPGTVMSRLFRARHRLQRSLWSYVRKRRLVVEAERRQQNCPRAIENGQVRMSTTSNTARSALLSTDRGGSTSKARTAIPASAR